MGKVLKHLVIPGAGYDICCRQDHQHKTFQPAQQLKLVSCFANLKAKSVETMIDSKQKAVSPGWRPVSTDTAVPVRFHRWHSLHSGSVSLACQFFRYSSPAAYRRHFLTVHSFTSHTAPNHRWNRTSPVRVQCRSSAGGADTARECVLLPFPVAHIDTTAGAQRVALQLRCHQVALEMTPVNVR